MPLRDEFATCPRCESALDEGTDRWRCSGCQGALLAEATVSQLLADMMTEHTKYRGQIVRVFEPEPLPLTARPANDPLTCPRCTATMAPVDLFGIELDRCDAHGLWFDRAELDEAMARTTQAYNAHAMAGEKAASIIVLTATVAAYILRFLAG